MNHQRKRRNFKTQRTQLVAPPPRYSEGLPILEKKQAIIDTIKENQVVVIAGETGSGKTTQLPVMCLEAGRGNSGKIGCTQPRRIAATSISRRVAQQLQCTLGQEVGYCIRFAEMDSPESCIKFMTDGILLTEIERSRLLEGYDTLIIDEAHERSLNIDFLLGYLRNLLPHRPDLKLIISSATIDTALFSKAFNNAPIIECSGRMYPVELLYVNEECDSENENKTYIDRTVDAVNDIVDVYGDGDMLIFMPTEADIWETCDRIGGLKLPNSETMPLFARLSRDQQERIFLPNVKRKIVVATNIAETSITVPGIRFVIDTGLARIARYAPRLRTSRLPIEPVSRASADQRKGRCGRVREGVCIRLYTEEEYMSREDYTPPEIKRSNLAGVVLSMKVHGLGDIESFPFLEFPSRQAISDGYALLRELGALDVNGNVTSIGREIASLPLDPHIARMVLAARKEDALREVTIIAAGLSIIDPRERPADNKAEADMMHKKFLDPSSDFLSFVQLWDAFQDEWQTLKTQNKMRTFCRDHFLSFNRMREWHDVHHQIRQILRQLKGFRENKTPASGDAIHRSLLTGLLTNCALRKEGNCYRAARGREVILFPGSALYGKGVEWIMCHEVVETSQVFARTAAPINPSWLEELAPGLCRRTYDTPYFNEESGIVQAKERVTLFGLPLTEHPNIRYGRVNPSHATEIFIQEALVEQRLRSDHAFYRHNKRLRHEIEKIEAKLRTRSIYAGDPAAISFYSTRLHNVSSIHDLNGLIQQKKTDAFLKMTEEDLVVDSVAVDCKKYPDTVTIGKDRFPISYTFEPGAHHDGATMRVPSHAVPYIPENVTGWLIPALWPDKIRELLRNLPKSIRTKLLPINERADEIARSLEISHEPFNNALSKAIKRLYGLSIDPSLLNEGNAAPHLSVRIEVYDKKGKSIVSGRGRDVLQNAADTTRTSATKQGSPFDSYKKSGLTSWSFGDLPATVEVSSSDSGVPLFGYPALEPEENTVSLILCNSPEKAARSHAKGVRKLLEIVLAHDLAWVEKETAFPKNLKLLCSPIGGAEKIRTTIISKILDHFLDMENIPQTEKAFEKRVVKIRDNLRGVGYEAVGLLESILATKNSLMRKLTKYGKNLNTELFQCCKKDLESYIEQLLEGCISFGQFRQYPRYLKAFEYRIDRITLDPAKYKDKYLDLQSFRMKEQKIAKSTEVNQKDLESLRLMIEEYAISLFAQQEVKTIFPISAKRLNRKIEEITNKHS